MRVMAAGKDLFCVAGEVRVQWHWLLEVELWTWEFGLKLFFPWQIVCGWLMPCEWSWIGVWGCAGGCECGVLGRGLG